MLHWKSWERTAKEESLEATLENRQIEGVDVTCWDRLFQVRAASTGKDQSLTVDSHLLSQCLDQCATSSLLISPNDRNNSQLTGRSMKWRRLNTRVWKWALSTDNADARLHVGWDADALKDRRVLAVVERYVIKLQYLRRQFINLVESANNINKTLLLQTYIILTLWRPLLSYGSFTLWCLLCQTVLSRHL